MRCYQASAPKVQSEGHARAIVGHVTVKMAQGRKPFENPPSLLILVMLWDFDFVFFFFFLLGD